MSEYPPLVVGDYSTSRDWYQQPQQVQATEPYVTLFRIIFDG